MPYVALSFLISAIGAFVALTASAGILGAGRPISRINLLAAGLALGGIGIWAMHFIGMLALRIEMGVGYAMVETLASLLFAVGGSSLALLWVARDPHSLGNLAAGGAVLGLAVCLMHYVGMYGMRFGGYFDWSPGLVAASVLIAWVAATAALVLAFAVRGFAARLVAALVMAGAVCAMHYTGMAAASFICTSATPGAIPHGFAVVSALELPVLVAVVALGMAFVISVDQFFQRMDRSQSRMRAARRANASR
ncbi:MAG: histidine kinase [Comamonadaceae bacterium]|nr:MAG: histidine kinase [Comamonadaceae bacterium]